MNHLVERASALRVAMTAVEGQKLSQPVAEAILSCCRDLIQAGETKTALEMIEYADSNNAVPKSSEWCLRVLRLKAQALYAARRFDEALALLRNIQNRSEWRLEPNSQTMLEARILEGATLAQMNRLDEAQTILIHIRTQLLGQPDSALLALCSLQLASAELFRGKLQTAKRYVLDGLVSSRRAQDEFTEGLALDYQSKLERRQCRWSAAEEADLEALKIFETNGHRVHASIIRRSLAIGYWKRGRLDEALALSSACRVEATQIGDQLLEHYAILLEGLIHLHAGRFVEARRGFETKEITSPSDARPALLVVEYLGDLHLEQGDPKSAIKLYDEIFPRAFAVAPAGDIVAELRRRRAE
ncbi:MAG: tetratricopeptide repeat protein, partial [Acidimicrobiia bacterium]